MKTPTDVGGWNGALTAVVAVPKLSKDCVGKAFPCFTAPLMWRPIVYTALAGVTVLGGFVWRNKARLAAAATI